MELCFASTDSLHLDVDLTEIIQKYHREGVAVDGGNNRVGSGNTLDVSFFNLDMTESIKRIAAAAPNY